MSETNCDHCTGLACGDECDGKSHAMTERACETCHGTGMITIEDIRMDGTYHGLPSKKCPVCRGNGKEPRPAAQDANELKPFLTKEQVWELNEKYGWFHYKDAQGDVSRAFANEAVAMYLDSNRRPSHPMIAEVDDGLLWQEIYSLREKLKIAVEAIKSYDHDFDDRLFMHRLNCVDYDQLMEELSGITPTVMSAEVEKAKRYITEIVETYDRLDGYISAVNAVSLARHALAALKEKVCPI